MKKLIITITKENLPTGGTVTKTDYEGDKELKKSLLKDMLQDLMMAIEYEDNPKYNLSKLIESWFK